jgi:hypothetical protein
MLTGKKRRVALSLAVSTALGVVARGFDKRVKQLKRCRDDCATE